MRVPLTARRVLVVSFTGLLGLAAGCSSAGTDATGTEDTEPDSSATETTTEPADPSVQSSCALAPASLIKETLKLEVSPPSEVSADSAVECTYPSGQNAVIIRFQGGRDATTFADRRREADTGGEPTSNVAGVGDEAYLSSVEFGDTVTNTMVSRKGKIEIEVVSVAAVDAEKALITKLFGAVGAA